MKNILPQSQEAVRPDHLFIPCYRISKSVSLSPFITFINQIDFQCIVENVFIVVAWRGLFICSQLGHNAKESVSLEVGFFWWWRRNLLQLWLLAFGEGDHRKQLSAETSTFPLLLLFIFSSSPYFFFFLLFWGLFCTRLILYHWLSYTQPWQGLVFTGLDYLTLLPRPPE